MAEAETIVRLLRPPGLYKLALALFACFFLALYCSNNPIIRISCVIGLSVVAIGLTLRFIVISVQRFFVIPKRIVELLATIAFGATCSTAVVRYFPKGSLESFLGLLLSVLLAFAGAAWGWQRARILNEQNPTRRLLLLLIGWTGIIGSIGVLVFTVSALHEMGLVHESGDLIPNQQHSWLTSMGYSAIAMPLSIPMIVIENRLRKKD